MAADHHHESLSILKALEKKLSLENAILLNKHLNAGVEEAEERANFFESLNDGVINKLEKLERLVEWIADGEERSFVIMEDMTRCVDEMDRLTKEVTVALKKSEKTVQNRANKMLERMFIESRQELQNEKEALLFAKLQEYLEIETRECEEITRNIQELRLKHEQQEDESAAVLRKITECERLCGDLKTELEDKHKLSEKATDETDKFSVILAELQAEEAHLRSLIPCIEAQREIEENKRGLVLEVEAMERLADEVEAKYEKLVAKQDEEYREIKLQHKACEDTLAHENAALQIQLTEAAAECHRMEMIKKSAERRLEAIKRKLEKEHCHVPNDVELEDILKKAALDREKQLGESREELYHLEKVRDAKKCEVKEKMAIMETQHQQKVAALEYKRNTLLKKKNDLDSQLAKERELKEAAEQLKKAFALLERKKTPLEEKIRAPTKNSIERSKEKYMITPRIKSGDSKTSEPALSIDVMEFSSAKAILIKRNHQMLSPSPFLCLDGSRRYGLCDNAVFWRLENSPTIVQPQRGPSSDIFDHSMSSAEFCSGDVDSDLVLKTLRPRRGPSSDIFDATLDSTTENEDATMKNHKSTTSLHNSQLNEIVQPKTEASCDIFDALAATFSEETEIENLDCDGSNSCTDLQNMKQPREIKEEFSFQSHFPPCRRFFTLP